VLDYLKRVLCRHEWVWSERRRKEVCYRCRQSRRIADSAHRLAPMTGAVGPSSLPGDTIVPRAPVEVRSAKVEAGTGRIKAEETVPPALNFGSLGGQSLNTAKVRDVRRT